MQKLVVSSFHLVLVLLISALVSPVFSQERCSTVPYMEKLRNEGKIKQTDTQFEQALEQRNRLRQQQLQTHRTEGSHYVIPVVVHIIHNGELVGTGSNISDEQILSQIDVLNKDFNRTNSDASSTPALFTPVAGAIQIEFVMARRDPNGLPTTGINRVKGTKTSWSMSNDAEFKALSYWPSEDYMNIWIVNFSSNFIGYAQFPVSNMPGLEEYQNGIAATDGIVIDYTTFGDIEANPAFNLDPQFNKGRTTTHEVGHFFGLRHIWGDGDCLTDYVNDTPRQKSSTTNCPGHPQSSTCDGQSIVKMFQNFLDYTDDACMNLFTQGQVQRMELVIDDPGIPRRNSLLTSPGLLDPDCNRIDVAILNIASPGPVTCDETAEFKINIRNRSCSNVTSIKVEYAVNQGQQQTATLTLSTPLTVNNTTIVTIPSVNFAGEINTITLAITMVNNLPDEDLSNSTITSRIVVDKSQNRIPLREKFTTLSWPVISPQAGINWQLSSTSFGTSASVQSFNQGTVGNQSWLVTPVLDFSSTFKASMFFDLSYAYNGTDFDRMEIVASTDCGNTYPISLFDQSGPGLSNTSSNQSWLPTEINQWRTGKYINLTSLAGNSDVRLAFVFSNARGNNIYLDNIEFYLSDNPDPVNIGDDVYSVYWSSGTEAELTFNLPERMPVHIQIVDILGRSYLDTTAPDILNQTFPIELGNATAGIYLLRVQAGNQFFVTKFYLSR